MQGNNKRFMDNPALFLSQTPLRIRARQEPPSPLAKLNPQANPPVFQFDLQPAAQGVELIQFAPHTKTHRAGTQRPITAYWLDYDHGKICSIPIGAAHAHYVFTPMLDGCYVGAGNNGVVHVAGDVPPPTTTAAMRNRAAAGLGGAPVIGFDSNLADANQCTFVGVRGNAGWSWYVQGHDYFYEGRGALQPVFNGGNSFIQITNLAHG
jgi:hypothetical protein